MFHKEIKQKIRDLNSRVIDLESTVSYNLYPRIPLSAYEILKRFDELYDLLGVERPDSPDPIQLKKKRTQKPS